MQDGSLYCCISDKAFPQNVFIRLYTECGRSLGMPCSPCWGKCPADTCPPPVPVQEHLSQESHGLCCRAPAVHRALANNTHQQECHWHHHGEKHWLWAWYQGWNWLWEVCVAPHYAPARAWWHQFAKVRNVCVSSLPALYLEQLALLNNRTISCNCSGPVWHRKLF